MIDPAALLSAAVADHPVVVEPRTLHTCRGGAHSRVADGRLVCWAPPSDAMSALPVAVDAEMRGQPVPPHLARRWSTDEPALVWPRWCATEVVAKLTHTPVVLLLNHPTGQPSPTRHGDVEVHWVVSCVTDLFVAYGVAHTVASQGGR